MSVDVGTGRSGNVGLGIIILKILNDYLVPIIIFTSVTIIAEYFEHSVLDKINFFKFVTKMLYQKKRKSVKKQ